MSGVAFRVGVDIGGTFTDTVIAIGHRLFSSKVLTTPCGARTGDHRRPAGSHRPGRHIAGCRFDGHPRTTLVTNALIERRGARTALITTKAFAT